MIPLTKPSVSVIVPVYNNIVYIGEAIESVLQQSFADFEIIIVDDGSTEDIKSVIQPYLDKHKNISYERQENRGPGPARNTGIRQAKGKWIAFLDSDDLWLPYKLEKQVAYLEENPNTIVSGGRQGLDCRVPEPVLSPKPFFFKNFTSGPETLTYLLEVPYFCALSSLVISKSSIENVGMFDESLWTVEDDDLIFRLVRKYPFYSIPEVVVTRRKHDESMTTGSALEPRIQNKYKVTKKILALIDDSEIIKSKKIVLGYWANDFAKRHIYWKSYGYALKWILTGLVLYPEYYIGRIRKKMNKIILPSSTI